MSKLSYTVEMVLVVDRPDLRDASFAPVPAGTRVRQSWRYATQAAAVAEFERVLAGEYDFDSEYVARVWVLRHENHLPTNVQWRRPTTVRKDVERAPARLAGPVTAAVAA